MNFESFQKTIKDFNSLPNVKFVSFVEDTILLEDKRNQALYEIPFTKEENQSFTLHLSGGKKVKDGVLTEEQQFYKNSQDLKNSIKKIFSSYDEGISEVKNFFKNVEDIDPSTFKKEMEKKVTFEDVINENIESGIEPVKKINKLFKKQLISQYQEQQEFMQLFNIFNENGSLKTHDINFSQLKDMYKNSYEESIKYNKNLNKMVVFHEEVKNIVINEDIALNVIKNIDFKKKAKVMIPKALISTQKFMGESFELNVQDASKKILVKYNEMFGDLDASEDFYNLHIGGSDEIPKFLKLSTGKYTRADVETLEHELEQSIYVLSDLTQEDLMTVANWRNECTYMSRTGIISDKKVDEIIKGFNAKFGANGNEAFNSDETLGFKDFDEQKQNSATGFANDMKDSKMDIEDVETPDDEEDFEAPKDAVIG